MVIGRLMIRGQIGQCELAGVYTYIKNECFSVCRYQNPIFMCFENVCKRIGHMDFCPRQSSMPIKESGGLSCIIPTKSMLRSRQ